MNCSFTHPKGFVPGYVMPPPMKGFNPGFYNKGYKKPYFGKGGFGNGFGKRKEFESDRKNQADDDSKNQQH